MPIREIELKLYQYFNFDLMCFISLNKKKKKEKKMGKVGRAQWVMGTHWLYEMEVKKKEKKCISEKAATVAFQLEQDSHFTALK